MIFYFCDAWQTKALYVVGIISAVVQGCLMPCMAIFMGDVLDSSASLASYKPVRNSSGTNTNASQSLSPLISASRTSEAAKQTNSILLSFAILSAGMFVAAFYASILAMKRRCSASGKII